MKKQNNYLIPVLVIAGFLMVMSSVTMLTFDVWGTNVTNASTITRVYVWNTEPNVTNIVISPDPVVLTPGNITYVNCTADVFDYNGWEDINRTNATFFQSGVATKDSGDDNNNHYTNSSCECTQGAGGTNATCVCTFPVQYYANNGSWVCEFEVVDNGGNATERIFNFNSSGNATTTLAEIVGIDVPAEIDYGNLSVTETSSLVEANVSNIGNVPINISVRGWGGQNESVTNAGNYSMICERNNISIDLERYFVANSSAIFDEMVNLSNTSTNVNDFTLPVRTNDVVRANDTNTTYWRIQIPLGIGGYCNGTIQFSAFESE